MITIGTKVKAIGNGGYEGLPEGDTGVVVTVNADWGYMVAFDNYVWHPDDIEANIDGENNLCMFDFEVEVYGG